MVDPRDVRWGETGLVPGIVQDANDGRVLMLGYLDEEALAATARTGEVHFHSRSRGRLWRKGETSGNVLRLKSAALDCDADALLLTVESEGPTCHRGTRSCFDPELRPGRETETDEGAEPPQGFGWLEGLWATIEDRARTRPAGSYTADLLNLGTDAVARKVTEEATEVLIAAKDDAAAQSSGADRDKTRAALAGEAADLVYHLLVLLASRDTPPSRVIGTLRNRAR
jgi:phosphoribosyl-ATP pyrophosphohydrolase/phosphoribosyl-AMP cyclohydrolase